MQFQISTRFTQRFNANFSDNFFKTNKPRYRYHLEKNLLKNPSQTLYMNFQLTEV